jgi:hypothetical protein
MVRTASAPNLIEKLCVGKLRKYELLHKLELVSNSVRRLSCDDRTIYVYIVFLEFSTQLYSVHLAFAAEFRSDISHVFFRYRKLWQLVGMLSK